ncbi:MAG: hypothetical protein CMJ49_01270 [Planctomycetaceae bacterium]|jgi:formamidopyrimidine-DNA glycosylase|nr:hypothetical protein [Planctomycetaceae bacterium]
MPELPEVERGRRIAHRALVGKRIKTVATANDRIVYAGVAPQRFARTLRRRTVVAALRRGKQLWLQLDQPPHPLFHFGMTGSFIVDRAGDPRPRFWKVILTADDGTRLTMPNARRLGRIRLLDDPPSQPPISNLGFDPLLDLPTTRQLIDSLANRRTPIKALLLDQSFAAGVGNWIADEVLYQSRIAPTRPAADLTPAEVAALRAKLRRIIHKAVDVDADNTRFPRTWLFHHRWGKNADAHTPAGHPIAHLTLAGRTTAWVPTVQR